MSDDILAGIAEADDECLPQPATATPAIPQPSGGAAFGGQPGDYAIWATNHMREKAREASRRMLAGSPGMADGILNETGRIKQINDATAKKTGSDEEGGIPMSLPKLG